MRKQVKHHYIFPIAYSTLKSKLFISFGLFGLSLYLFHQAFQGTIKRWPTEIYISDTGPLRLAILCTLLVIMISLNALISITYHRYFLHLQKKQNNAVLHHPEQGKVSGPQTCAIPDLLQWKHQIHTKTSYNSKGRQSTITIHYVSSEAFPSIRLYVGRSEEDCKSWMRKVEALVEPFYREKWEIKPNANELQTLLDLYAFQDLELVLKQASTYSKGTQKIETEDVRKALETLTKPSWLEKISFLTRNGLAFCQNQLGPLLSLLIFACASVLIYLFATLFVIQDSEQLMGTVPFNIMGIIDTPILALLFYYSVTPLGWKKTSASVIGLGAALLLLKPILLPILSKGHNDEVYALSLFAERHLYYMVPGILLSFLFLSSSGRK